jgi:hypothetical protein
MKRKRLHTIKPDPRHHTVVIIKMSNPPKRKNRKVISVSTETFRSIYNAERRAHELRDITVELTVGMPYIIKTEILERAAA